MALILDQHEKVNLPESNWPDQQATHCRQDIEIIRQSVLSHTCELGERLGVRELDLILPP